MPFTIGGDWVPSQTNENIPKKAVTVRLVKRGHNILTVIFNLNKTVKELEELASALKKKLGCGGAIKDGNIEIQGDKTLIIQKYLKEQGIKASK